MDPFTLSLTAGSAHTLRQRLAALCTAADIRYASIVQEAGVVMSDCGDASHRDHGEIGAIATGAFSSARELARRLGESEFAGLHYEGRDRHFFLSPLTREFFLLCVFGNDTRIAIVRTCVTRATPALAAELDCLHTGTPLPSDFHIEGLDDATPFSPTPFAVAGSRLGML